MANALGGWYLSGSTLQYRKLDTDGTTLTNTVLASITGLTGLKMEDGVVKVNRGSGSWSAISDTDITVEETEAVAANPEANPPVDAVPGKINFKIGNSILGSSNISVSGSNDYKAYMDFIDESQKVHIDGTETITYDSSNGKATIIADLTAGFTLNKLDGTANSATYNSGKTNQTLATISGLQKNYTASTEEDAVSTVAFEKTKKDDTSGKATEAGYLTLSKVSDTENADATTVSALGTGAITLTNQSIATNNGINYYLKLGGIEGDYVQKNTTDEAAYWTVKGTTATYQYYSPTGYQLTDSSNNIIDNTDENYSTNQTKATKIKVTAAKTTTVVTVTGLAQNLTTNATDSKIAAAKALSTTSGESPLTNTRTLSIADVVGSGQARTVGSASADFVSGIIVTSGPSADDNKPTYKTGTTLDTSADNGGKGKVTINITKAALPTSGTVTVTPGSAFTATVTTGEDFYKKSDADAASDNKVKKKRIWVINGNTATYKEVDLAYYEVQDRTANGVTKIVCTAQTGGTVLATIKGLNEDWLANEANLTRSDEITTAGTKSYELDNSKKDTGKVITAIKGITFTKEAGYTYGTDNKPKADTNNVGEITLSSEVLAGMNVTIGGSENFKLALLAANDSSTNTTAVALPTFSNYKWNLNNNTATLKGDITAGYWAADNGKIINYTATAKNQTLATVKGLKSGTQLNSSNGDIRTIGNYTSTSAGAYTDFKEGVKINSSNTLAHKTDLGSKTLIRMPITISKHVLGTSQVNLTSNFFTLALDQNIDSDATAAQKIASKTYVLDKTEAEAAADTIDWHGSLGSTSTLKQSTPAYYTLGDADAAGTVKKITYTKPGTATTVATVKGLNSAITENDIAFDTANHVITIKTANALTTSNVTIENPKNATVTYTLALAPGVDALGEATLIDKTWKQNGTTLSYTAKVTGAGYKLNNDANIITYTKEATSTPTTLATITGIRAGLVTDTNGVDISSTTIPGVTFDETKGTVTLTKAALNNANVKLSGNGNYKLLINKDSSGNAITSGENYIVTTEPDPKQIWVISGSTATYKTVIPEYYKYDATANSLTYVKPADAKWQNKTSGKENYSTDTTDTTKFDSNGNGKTIPALGQIKGLKNNLVVSADGQKIGYYDSTGTFKEAITFGTDADAKKITIKDDYVLDYKSSVTLDNAAINNGYRIYLDTTTSITRTVDDREVSKTLDKWVRPEASGTPEWTISRGTATYKGNVSSGYANSDDGKSIIFSAAKTNTEIAKITGLDTTLTTLPANTGLQVGTDDNANVITVYNDVLTDKDAKLTTTIKLTGSNYKLALGTGDKAVKSTYEGTETHKGWTVSGTTATYGTWTPTYYTLNNATGEAADTITYNGEGFLEGNQIATVSGLVSGLVTIQDDQIRGIVLGSTTITGEGADAVTTFTEDSDQPKATGKIIKLSANVLPTSPKKDDKITVTMKNENTGYTLELDDDLKPQTTTAYKIEKYTDTTSKLTINDMLTAGYTATDNTTFTYEESKNAGEGVFATITGLKKDITLNSNGTIDSIKVTRDNDNKTITLFKGALTDKEVVLTSTNYKLKLATSEDAKDDYDSQEAPPGATSGKYGWKATTTKGKFELYQSISTSGYKLNNDGKTVTYSGGSGFDNKTAVATIEGLNTNITLNGTSLEDAGISVSSDGKTITISKQALGGKDVKVTTTDSSKYALKLNTTEGNDGYVAASKKTATWSISKGTATYKEEISEGYALDTTDTTNHTIKYTPKGTITTTLTNLSQENLTAADDMLRTTYISTTTEEVDDGSGGTTQQTTTNYYGIKFENGVFTVTDSDALAHKAVALKTSVSGTGLKDPGYTLELGNDKDLKVGETPVSIKATVKAPVWVKSNTTTTATYTQETASGYSLSGDEKNIVYSNDPKFVDLATVSNLKKDVELSSDGKIVTTAADGTKSTANTASIEKVTDPSDDGSGTTTVGTIKVAKELFDGKNVTLKNTDKYVFTDDSVENEPTATQIWTISGSTATYKNVTPAYYSFTQANDADNKRSIKYNAQADYKGEDGTTAAELTKITGLKSVKLDSKGYVLDSTGAKLKDASGNEIKGLEVNGESVTLSSAVLGTSTVTSDKYALSLRSGDVVTAETDVTEWVGNGTTYTNKKYNKAYYTLDTANGSKKVTYTAAKDIETYATITGLAKDLIASGATADQTATAVGAGTADTTTGYTTITLGATQLAGVTGTVKLTTANGGKFKLALDTTSADKVKESITTTADAWTTSGTTATLKGFKSAGYTLNDSGDTITYQKEGTKGDDGKQTEVTVATVKGLKSGATIANSDVTDGTDDDEGTKIITLKLSQLGTSNVTLTGDGYKLAVADDVKSGNDDPKWVKTTTATKATFSQNNHNGFTASADGKTLTYWKNKSNNFDLATINGLAKTFDASKMGVIDTAGTTTIDGKYVVINTKDKTITLTKEALGSNKITLGNKDDYTLKLAGATGGKVGGDTLDKATVVNNGTLSIVSGKAESWEETSDGKSLNYTAAKVDTYATISGLPKDKTADELVTVSDNEIKVKTVALPTTNNGNITLTNKTVSGTHSNYTLALEDSPTDTDSPTAAPSDTVNKKQWALNGTTLTLKGYKSGGYKTANTNDGMKITYTADNGYTDLASIKFTGVANNFLKLVNGKIYLSTDMSSPAVTFDDDMDQKTISLDDTLLNAIKTKGDAASIAISGKGDYYFSSLSDLGNGSETSVPNFYETSFQTAGKATLQRKTTAGWKIDDADMPKTLTYVKQSFASAGTINGISKTYDSTMHDSVGGTNLILANPDGNETVGSVTVGAAALTNSNVTFSKVNGGYNYKIVLADNVANDTSWVNKTEWVNNNGAADYKTYDAAHWAQDTDQIKYIGPKNDKSYARISGMSKTASIEDADVSGGVITLHAADLGTSKVTLSINKVSSVSNEALNAKITAGNNTASAFKLALDSDVTLLSSVEDAVWDNNGTVATLTGTIKKGYKLSNDQKSVTYQSADKKLQQIAKVSGIKKDSQILDNNVTTDTSNAALPNLKKITLTNEHLGTSNVQLTGEGYKLALSGDVLIDGEEADNAKWQNQTEWVNNNGTFTYKTYDKIHYKLNDAGTQVQYIAAKDDSSNDQHKTFAQITGLAKDALPTAISPITDTSNDNTVKNGGVISLSDNLLNKATIKLTDTQTSGYTLNMDNVNDSLKSTVSNFNASVSGTGTNIKADWVGTQGKGYFLNNDMQNITYYSAAKTNQTIAKVTGLASTVTSDNNDAFSAAYTASDNVVALGAASLGSSVTVSGTAAFNLGDGDYKDAQIVGSSSADKLTVSGSNLSINAGGGNDIVDLTGASNSTFLYANGNGNDIITGIGSNTIKITNLAKENKDKDGNVTKTNITVQTDTKNTADTIVKVNTSTIRVKGVPSGVKVFDKDGAEVSYPDPANVLADDNYAMTPQNTSADEDYAMSPNLSSIVKGATSSYTTEDLATDDATSLAKQSTAVSYSGKK